MRDRLFLDANILFSAAWSCDAKVRVLWQLREVTLVTSDYALGEATRNLETDAQHARLDDLMADVSLGVEIGLAAFLFADIQLPDKDMPILVAAIESGATHLITGDKRHFGFLFGQRVNGVLVCTPRFYLKDRENHT